MASFVVDADNHTKPYDNVFAMDSVNLRVKQGESYGVLGLDAAGRTTAARLSITKKGVV